MILIFIKSMVAGHTRTLPNGKVVQVRPHSNRRSRHDSGQSSLFGNAGLGLINTGRVLTVKKAKRYLFETLPAVRP